MVVLLGLLLLGTPGWMAAQEDEAGCKDHPTLSRVSGFYIDSCDSAEFDAAEFDVGDGKIVTVEGKKTILRYAAKEGARKVSELQILRNYEAAVKRAGGTVVWSDPPLRRSVVRFVAGGREIWLAIRAYYGADGYELLFIEEEPMVQEVSASEMLAALNRDGRIALYIQFDTAQAAIRPESAPIIEQMAALLKENPILNVTVEGHTDNVGTAAANQLLSEQRAKSVVAAVLARGIEARRLTAAGFGMSKPIADNSTEEGRAKNRRVELVRR